MARLRFLALAALFLLLGGGARPAAAQSGQTHVDYVILIDVSGSMAGHPAGSGNVDIFPKVKDAITRFISELPPGNSVLITPFAERLGQTQRFEIVDSTSARRAEDYVRSLEANGSETHVYEALGEVFGRYNQLRANEAERIGVLLVFTDGVDNGPQHLTMGDVVQRFGLQRRENDFLYYATLGVNLPERDVAALSESGFSTHDPSPSGDVHPVRVVQPRYGLLVFGNLQRNPASERVLAMDVQGTLPGDFRLRARTSFPVLAQRGTYVEVSPSAVPVADTVRLGLRLVNAEQVPTGDYDGTIQLESPDPRVIVVPRQIRARFTYAPPRTAQVLPAPGASTPRLQLGRADPYRAADGRAAPSDSLTLDLDAEAVAHGGSFAVRVRQDPGNPAVLPSDAVRVNGVAGDAVTVDAAARKLRLAFALRRAQVRPGRYRGTLLLEDGSVEMRGTHEIPWEFEVDRPPLSAGAIAGIVAAALAVLAALALFLRYWFTGGISAALLRGRLTVREPNDAYGQEIALAGRREVTIGSGTGELPAARGRIRIVPERSRTTFRIKVVAEDGTVLIRRPGETFDVPVASESLRDGDLISIPPYRLEYSRL
jgi:hypothetical protein